MRESANEQDRTPEEILQLSGKRPQHNWGDNRLLSLYNELNDKNKYSLLKIIIFNR